MVEVHPDGFPVRGHPAGSPRIHFRAAATTSAATPAWANLSWLPEARLLVTAAPPAIREGKPSAALENAVVPRSKTLQDSTHPRSFRLCDLGRRRTLRRPHLLLQFFNLRLLPATLADHADAAHAGNG